MMGGKEGSTEVWEREDREEKKNGVLSQDGNMRWRLTYNRETAAQTKPIQCYMGGTELGERYLCDELLKY